MSRKGRSLGNRPSEYFFAQIQREKFDFYDISHWNYNGVYNLINNYMWWYNSERVQSNLQYKTHKILLHPMGYVSKFLIPT